jgi:hypothetical protein
MDKPAIHDIRLRFECKGLWSILPLYSSDSLIENMDLKINRDITLYDINLKDFVIKPTIHKTDTVSIAIACSESPVPLNLEGLAKLTSGLTRIEERLQRVVDEYIKHNLRSSQLSSLISKTPIPNHETWIITMWHFGQDSLTGYTGERFEISWKEGLKVFRIYSKEYRNKKTMKIRKETQEYPNKSLEDAFRKKISSAEDKI